MNNREFRNDVQEVWLRQYAKANPVEIATAADMVKLTAKFAAGCALAMGTVILAMMVVL